MVNLTCHWARRLVICYIKRHLDHAVRQFWPHSLHIYFPLLSFAILWSPGLPGEPYCQNKSPWDKESSCCFTGSKECAARVALPPHAAMICAHVGDALLGRWLCGDDVSLMWCHVAEVGGVTMTSYALPFAMAEIGGEATKKFEISWNGCPNPCNFLIAYICKVLATACSHSKHGHIYLHNDSWTSRLFTGPLKLMPQRKNSWTELNNHACTVWRKLLVWIEAC